MVQTSKFSRSATDPIYIPCLVKPLMLSAFFKNLQSAAAIYKNLDNNLDPG